MEGLPPGDEACFCRPTEMAFLRLLTTAAVVGEDLVMTNAQAQDLYLKLRTDERVGWLDEPPGLREAWFRHARWCCRGKGWLRLG
jgi:hypothetical protein